MSAAATLLFVVTMPVSTLVSYADGFHCGHDKGVRAVECYRSEVKQFLQSWVIAWGDSEVNDYIEHYATFESPRPDMTRSQWEAERKNRLTRNEDIAVTLELDSMGISDSGDVDVIFLQNYVSDSYHDVVKKQLFLQRSPDGLKIKREVVLEQ